MMMLALAAALLGAMLGVRFTVFAVIPAIAFASLVAGIGWFLGDGAFGSLMVKLALLAACLQLGYIGGAVLRFSLVSMGGARERERLGA